MKIICFIKENELTIIEINNKIKLCNDDIENIKCNKIAKEKLEEINESLIKLDNELKLINNNGLVLNNLSKKLYFGEKTNLSVVQTLSGTGSLYLLAQLLGEIITENKTIYISNPTWGNHFSVFHTSKLQLSTYDYLQKDRTWNFNFLYVNFLSLSTAAMKS